MSTQRIFRILVILLVISINIGCDQVSKVIVRKNISYHEQIQVIPDYFTLTRIENSGAFLSLGDNFTGPLKYVLLLLLPAGMLVYALYYLFSARYLPKAILTGLCFIIGGGLGNMYDRVVSGSVTDFMHLDFVIFQTGIFNLADVSIMTGTALILFHSFTGRNEKVPAQ